jgi:hypothetical protein
MKQRRLLGRWSTALSAALALLGPGTASAQTAPAAVATPVAPAVPAAARQTVPFVTHASFFSLETHRSPTIDPEVFVHDATVAEGTGPQNIEHVAGYRPARIDDDPELVAYNAMGASLQFTLEKWFGATGTVDIDRATSGDRLTFAFQKLIPFGVYSVFRVTFSQDGTTFAPLDGDGTTNGFTANADGSAAVVINSPVHLRSGEAVVLVYHSDAKDHAASRGEIGVNAHHQLIARLP